MTAATATLACTALVGCQPDGGMQSWPPSVADEEEDPTNNSDEEPRMMISQPATTAIEDLCHLESDNLSAAIHLQSGRVMEFRPAGGDNVLWTNPSELEREDLAFSNHGGDKVWPWPQSEWIGGEWPPPAPFNGGTWKADVSSHRVTLTCDESDHYGVRPTRIIEQDAAGLTVRSDLERTANDENPPAAAAWHVTQIPRDAGAIVAIARDDSPAEPVWLNDPNRPEDLAELVTAAGDIDGRVVWQLNSLPDRNGKAGLDGDILAADVNGTLFVQYLAAGEGEMYSNDAHRLQVYIHVPVDEDPVIDETVGSWAELEMTSPLGSPTHPASLTVRWLLAETEAGDAKSIAKQAIAMVEQDRNRN